MNDVCQCCGRRRAQGWARGRRIVLAALRGQGVNEIQRTEDVSCGQVHYALKRKSRFAKGVFEISDLALRVYWGISQEEVAATGAHFNAGFETWTRSVAV